MGNALLYGDGPVTLAASTGPADELVLHVIDRGPGTAGLASPPSPAGVLIACCCCRGGRTRENTDAAPAVRAYYELIGLEGWPVSARRCLPGVDP